MTTKHLLIATLLLCCLSCQKDSKRVELPNDLLINQVISRVIELDSLSYENRILIARQLCPYTLDYSLDKIKREGIPKSPNYKSINPISPKVIIESINQRVAGTFSNSDISFIASQISHSKKRYLDTLQFSKVKLVEIKFSQQKDCFRLDSIFIFYVPIFSSNKSYVYVNYHYKRGGVGTIMKWDNDKWIIIEKFDTWNTD